MSKKEKKHTYYSLNNEKCGGYIRPKAQKHITHACLPKRSMQERRQEHQAEGTRRIISEKKDAEYRTRSYRP